MLALSIQTIAMVVAILAVVVLLLLAAWAAYMARCKASPPHLAAGKHRLDCGIPGGLPQPDNQDYSLQPADTRGIFAHRTIMLDAGKRIDLTGGLTLFAREGITILGGIQNTGGSRTDITLVTLGGQIVLALQR